MNLIVATMYRLVKSGASGKYFFSASSASSVVNPRRPSRNSNLVPRLAVVGGVLLLSSRTAAAANKNTLDYDMCSRRWSRTTARPCRARDGVGVISSLSIPRNSISDHAARCRVLHTSRAAPHRSWPSVHSSRPRNAHYWVSC